MIKFIDNIGDFFSSNYFDEDFVKKVHDKSGYSFDDQKEPKPSDDIKEYRGDPIKLPESTH